MKDFREGVSCPSIREQPMISPILNRAKNLFLSLARFLIVFRATSGRLNVQPNTFLFCKTVLSGAPLTHLRRVHRCFFLYLNCKWKYIVDLLSIFTFKNIHITAIIWELCFLFLKVCLHNSHSHLMNSWKSCFDNTKVLKTSISVRQHDIYTCWSCCIFNACWNLY